MFAPTFTGENYLERKKGIVDLISYLMFSIRS